MFVLADIYRGTFQTFENYHLAHKALFSHDDIYFVCHNHKTINNYFDKIKNQSLSQKRSATNSFVAKDKDGKSLYSFEMNYNADKQSVRLVFDVIGCNIKFCFYLFKLNSLSRKNQSIASLSCCL